jgi:hypothetical protein
MMVMPTPEIVLESIPVRCRIYGLSVCQSNAAADGRWDGTGHGTDADQWETQTIIMGDRPFHVQVTVEWLGSAAIALLMLNPLISADFYIKPVGVGEDIEIGSIAQSTSASQRSYTLALGLESPDQQGIEPGLYYLYATVRVGADEGPALLWDVIDGVRIEVLTPVPNLPTADDSGAHDEKCADGVNHHGSHRDGNGGRSPDASPVNARSKQFSKKSRKKR